MGLIDGYAAVLGISEKGSLEYRFTARSSGGHAANPPKNSPIARLAALVTEAETAELFPVRMIPGIRAMLLGFAEYAEGERKERGRREEGWTTLAGAAKLTAGLEGEKESDA